MNDQDSGPSVKRLKPNLTPLTSSSESNPTPSHSTHFVSPDSTGPLPSTYTHQTRPDWSLRCNGQSHQIAEPIQSEPVFRISGPIEYTTYQPVCAPVYYANSPQLLLAPLAPYRRPCLPYHFGVSAGNFDLRRIASRFIRRVLNY